MSAWTKAYLSAASSTNSSGRPPPSPSLLWSSSHPDSFYGYSAAPAWATPTRSIHAQQQQPQQQQPSMLHSANRMLIMPNEPPHTNYILSSNEDVIERNEIQHQNSAKRFERLVYRDRVVYRWSQCKNRLLLSRFFLNWKFLSSPTLKFLVDNRVRIQQKNIHSKLKRSVFAAWNNVTVALHRKRHHICAMHDLKFRLVLSSRCFMFWFGQTQKAKLQKQRLARAQLISRHQLLQTEFHIFASNVCQIKRIKQFPAVRNRRLLLRTLKLWRKRAILLINVWKMKRALNHAMCSKKLLCWKVTCSAARSSYFRTIKLVSNRYRSIRLPCLRHKILSSAFFEWIALVPCNRHVTVLSVASRKKSSIPRKILRAAFRTWGDWRNLKGTKERKVKLFTREASSRRSRILQQTVVKVWRDIGIMYRYLRGFRSRCLINVWVNAAKRAWRAWKCCTRKGIHATRRRILTFALTMWAKVVFKKRRSKSLRTLASDAQFKRDVIRAGMLLVMWHRHARSAARKHRICELLVQRSRTRKLRTNLQIWQRGTRIGIVYTKALGTTKFQAMCNRMAMQTSATVKSFLQQLDSNPDNSFLDASGVFRYLYFAMKVWRQRWAWRKWFVAHVMTRNESTLQSRYRHNLVHSSLMEWRNWLRLCCLGKICEQRHSVSVIRNTLVTFKSRTIHRSSILLQCQNLANYRCIRHCMRAWMVQTAEKNRMSHIQECAARHSAGIRQRKISTAFRVWRLLTSASKARTLCLQALFRSHRTARKLLVWREWCNLADRSDNIISRISLISKSASRRVQLLGFTRWKQAIRQMKRKHEQKSRADSFFKLTSLSKCLYPWIKLTELTTRCKDFLFKKHLLKVHHFISQIKLRKYYKQQHTRASRHRNTCCCRKAWRPWAVYVAARAGGRAMRERSDKILLRRVFVKKWYSLTKIAKCSSALVLKTLESRTNTSSVKVAFQYWRFFRIFEAKRRSVPMKHALYAWASLCLSLSTRRECCVASFSRRRSAEQLRGWLHRWFRATVTSQHSSNKERGVKTRRMKMVMLKMIMAWAMLAQRSRYFSGLVLVISAKRNRSKMTHCWNCWKKMSISCSAARHLSRNILGENILQAVVQWKHAVKLTVKVRRMRHNIGRMLVRRSFVIWLRDTKKRKLNWICSEFGKATKLMTSLHQRNNKTQATMVHTLGLLRKRRLEHMTVSLWRECADHSLRISKMHGHHLLKTCVWGMMGVVAVGKRRMKIFGIVLLRRAIHAKRWAFRKLGWYSRLCMESRSLHLHALLQQSFWVWRYGEADDERDTVDTDFKSETEDKENSNNSNNCTDEIKKDEEMLKNIENIITNNNSTQTVIFSPSPPVHPRSRALYRLRFGDILKCMLQVWWTITARKALKAWKCMCNRSNRRARGWVTLISRQATRILRSSLGIWRANMMKHLLADLDLKQAQSMHQGGRSTAAVFISISNDDEERKREQQQQQQQQQLSSSPTQGSSSSPSENAVTTATATTSAFDGGVESGDEERFENIEDYCLEEPSTRTMTDDYRKRALFVASKALLSQTINRVIQAEYRMLINSKNAQSYFKASNKSIRKRAKNLTILR